MINTRTILALGAVTMVAAWSTIGAAQGKPSGKPLGGGIGLNRPTGPDPEQIDGAAVRNTSGCREEPPHFYPCAIAKAKMFNPPRTRDGKPNFEGYWGRNPDTGLAAFFGARSVIVDTPGNPPYQPWALARVKSLQKEFLDPVARCMPQGVPRFYIAPGAFRIMQTPDTIMFAVEQVHNFRIVLLDGRPHPGPKIRFWMGDPVARWEGNSLVIDTTNFNGLTMFNVQTDFASEALHLVERLTLIDKDNLLYEATIEDPNVFTRPFKVAWGRTRDPRQDKGLEILEEGCHEGNWRWLDGELATGMKIITEPLRKP